MIPTLIKDKDREHKENRLSSFERGMNKQKKRKANRERKKSRLDTVSVMMRRRKRHNQIVRFSESCIQWGPLTQSIVMDNACHRIDLAFFICLHVAHGNNNSPDYCIENLSDILSPHLFFTNGNY